MTTFRYRAITATKEIVEGSLEAPDRASVVNHLRGLGYLPVRAEEANSSSIADLLNVDILGGSRPSQREVALFSSELSLLLNAGVELERSLEILTTVGDRTAHRTLATGVLDEVRRGNSLAEALAHQGALFPAYFIGMVRAGESGGALAEVLTRLAEFEDRRRRTREAIRSALVYPIILVVTSLASIAFLICVVLPQFKPLFEGAHANVPWTTMAVMGVGDFLRESWWVAVSVFVGGVAAVWTQCRREPVRRRLDRFVLFAPVAGPIVRDVQIARFARGLGTMLHNGVPMTQALDIIKGTISNAFISSEFRPALAGVREGVALSAAIGSVSSVPRMARQLLSVGEETGQLSQMLLKVADIYDDEAQRRIQRALSLLTPVLTIVLGLLVAGMITSVLTAILSVNELVL